MMIGEKKIEQLIKEICEKKGMDEAEQATMLKMAKMNMRWVITLFKMELWHKPTEEPKGYDEWVLLHYSVGDYYSLQQVKSFKSWANFVKNIPIGSWCYIDDILPKEGGEQWKSTNLENN